MVCLLKGHELADCIVAAPHALGSLQLSKILKQHRAQRSIHFPKSLRPVFAAWLARVPERIGISDSGAKLFNTHHAPFWGAKGLFVERYYSALAARWPDLPPLPYAHYLPNIQVDKPKNNYICLMPGSIWLSKEWPIENYRKIADLATQSGTDVAVLGAASERWLGDAILKRTGHNLCGQTDLQQAAAWLHGASAAVGNDSGLSHLAAACGTHTFAIFGPTDSGGSAPWGPNVVVLRPEGLPCAPCFKRQCPLPERKCLSDISPNLVWEHIRPLIH
jgi:lipopolysaccharide heptosyltransferase II